MTNTPAITLGRGAFGDWLRQRRRSLDLTQNDLALRAACAVVTLRKFESGDLVPSRELAGALAKALEIPSEQHETFILFARGNQTPLAPVIQPPPSENASSLVTTSAAPSAIAKNTAPPPNTKYTPPAPLMNMIGREHDLDVACKLLRLKDVRLLTISGAPGTGKTRLSLEIARELLPDFADGVCVVALAALQSASQVVSAIMQALGLSELAGQSPHASLRLFLVAKQLLLVLDNFEHVLDAAPLVSDLLSAAPQLRVLITSREGLRIYGERELILAPLPIPQTSQQNTLDLLEIPAIRLFVERAQAVQPAFTLNASNVAAIVTLCTQLDGLPLAIEMVAARIRWHTPQVLLGQLNQRLNLSLGQRTLTVAHHSTLRSTLDWSYTLLSPTEQHALCWMGVFAGGCTAASFRAVCDGADDETLQALCEKNLLCYTPDQVPRFWLLETMREFAREHLAAKAELGAAQLRHTTHYLALAKVYQAEQWLNLQAEHNNFAVALNWALSQTQPTQLLMALQLSCVLQPYWVARGHLSEGLRWIEQAIAHARNAASDAPALLAHAHHAWAVLAQTKGDYVIAKQQYETSLAMRQALGDPSIVDSLAGLGKVYDDLGDITQAQILFEEGLALGRQYGDEQAVANVLGVLGQAENRRWQLTSAVMHLEEAVSISRRMGYTRALSYALGSLGLSITWQGHYARARNLLAECLALIREIGATQLIGNSLAGLSIGALEQGDDETAGQGLTESLRLAQTEGNLTVAARWNFHLGRLALGQGDLDAARHLFEQNIALGEVIGPQSLVIGLSKFGLANVDLANGDYDNIQKFGPNRLSLARTRSDQYIILGTLQQLAYAALMRLNDRALAHRYFNEKLSVACQIGHRAEIILTLADLGYVALRDGNFVETERDLAEALHIARQIEHDYFHRTSLVLWLQAGLAARQNQPVMAAECLAEAMRLEPTLPQRLRAQPHIMQQDMAEWLKM